MMRSTFLKNLARAAFLLSLFVLLPASPVSAQGTEQCTEGDETMCLNSLRFEVTATFITSQGQSGTAQAQRLTNDTGYFWFFNAANVEIIIKVLDACGLNQNFWVFAGGLTNVDVEITVRDTQTGNVKVYNNPQNTPFEPIQDTGAFATCP